MALPVETTPRLHHVKISVPEGRAYLTRIELDGEELRGVAFVKFEIGPIGFDRKDAILTVKLYADVEFEGEPEIVKQWRRAEADA